MPDNILSPKRMAAEAFTDAAAAVARLAEIYERNVSFLRAAFEAYVRGEPLDARVRAAYPFVRITTGTHARLDSRLSYADEQVACAVKHQAALLLRSFYWYKPHVGSGNCLANSLCVSCIVLLTLDVGLYISWRHQPHGMAECLKFARPIVRRGAGLYANQAWRQLLKEREDVATL